MYVDGYMLFAIYAIAVLALAVSVYALWSLEEIRRYYEKKNNLKSSNAYEQYTSKPATNVNRLKGHKWD
jgi:flagellar basal body-associated protein FliL